MKYKCLSIAGFDGSGGAGIQADLKTFSSLGCYGMTVLTALAVQNTQGVKKCYELPLDSIELQLQAIFEDIKPNAIKIGMLFSSKIIQLIVRFLKNSAVNIPIILDPVMVATSGDKLLLPDAINCFKTELLPIANVITPNLYEASILTNQNILSSGYTYKDMEQLAIKIISKNKAQAVLIKGGHLNGNQANDLFLSNDGSAKWFTEQRIQSKNTHGTGCTLSSAIAAFTAHGFSILDSCCYAKKYLTGAIKAAQNNSVGIGDGPVHHFYHLQKDIHNFLKNSINETI